MNIRPVVSVIIPVYNEEAIITCCLDSLEKLNYPKELTEIIAIDNNSRDKSAELIKKYPSVKYIFEARKGRSAARNTGIKAANGEIIAFIDADCVVSPDWLNNIIPGLKSKTTGCCGGKTLSYYPENMIEHYFDWSFESHAAKILNFSEKYFIGPIFATSNLICRREVFDAVGFFDEYMTAGEDTDLVWRINLKGYQLNYVPGAVVYHKRRDKLSELPEAFFQYIYWQYYLIAKYENIGFSYDFTRAIRNLFGDISGILKNLFNPKINAKQRGIDVFHVVFSLCSIVTTLYAWVDIKLLRRRSFNGLSFTAEKVIWRWNEDGEAMLVNLSNGTGYQLNEVSTRVWQLLNEGRNREEILNGLTDEYDGGADEIRDDVNRIIDDFLKEALIGAGTREKLCKAEKA